MSNRINDPINIGSTPTDNKELSTKKKNGFSFGVNASNDTATIISGTGKYKPSTRNIDDYKDYLPGTEGIYTPEELWDSERALSQSNLAQLGSAATRVVLNTVPEIIKQAARTFDFSFDYETDNALAQGMTDLQNKVNEIAPIYREDPTKSMDFGDFAYWMEQGSNLVTSAAAFAALGYGIGGALSKGVQGIKALGTVAQSTRAAQRVISLADEASAAITAAGESATLGGRVAKTTQSAGRLLSDALKTTFSERNIVGLTNTVLLNKAESTGVALDTFQSVYQTELEKEKNKDDGKSDAEKEVAAKQKASEAAAFAFKFNQANILLNLSSSFAFIKPGLAGARQELAKVGLKHSALDIVKESAQEYAEETINFVAQKRAEDGDGGKSFSEQLQNALTKGLEEAGSTEAREAGLWGALGGMAQTGFTKVGGYIPFRRNEAYTMAYDKHFADIYRKNPDMAEAEIKAEADKKATAEVGASDKKVSTNYIKNYKNNILNEEREKIKNQFGVNFNDDGDAMLDAKDSSDIFLSTEAMFKLDSKIAEADKAGDDQEVQRLSEQKLDFQIVRAMRTGTLNTLENTIKSLKDISQDEAVQIGIAEDENDTAYKQKVDQALTKIRDFETIFNRNKNLQNSEDVTDLDLNIYRITQAENTINDRIQEEVDKQYQKNYKSFFDNYTNKSFVPYVPDNYYQLSTKERRKIDDALTSEQRAIVSEKTRELENDVKPVDVKQLPADMQDDFTFLQTLKTRKEQDIATRNVIAGKEFQNLLKKAKIEAVRQAEDEERARKARVKAEKQAEKNKEREAKNIAKEAANNKPSSTTPATPVNSNSASPTSKSTETSSSVDSTDAGTPSTSTTSTAPSNNQTTTVTVNDGVVSINTPQGTNAAPVSNVSAVSKAQEDFKIFKGSLKNIDENTEVILKVIEGRLADLHLLFSTNKIIDVAKIDKALKSINDSYDLLRFSSLSDKKKDILETHLDKTASLLTIAKDVMAAGAALTEAAQAAQAIQNLSSPESADSEEDFEEDFEDDEGASDEETPVDLNEEMEKQQLRNTARTAEFAARFANFIDTLYKLGVPVNTYNDFEKGISKVISYDSLVSLRPYFIRSWNALATLNGHTNRMVDSAFFREGDSLSAEEYAVNRAKNAFWTDEDNNQVTQYMREMVNDTNRFADTPVEERSYSGTGDLAFTSFKLAYLAKPYYQRVEGTERIVTLRKRDEEGGGLNPNVDHNVLDPDAFLKGTKLVFSPLRVDATHSYWDDKKNRYIVIKRINKDEVQIKEYLSTDTVNGGAESTYIKPVTTHLPIFVKTGDKKKVGGTFIHTPDWVRPDNIPYLGEKKGKTPDQIKKEHNQQLDQERKALTDFRESIIYNKGRSLVTATVTAVSEGKLLTDGKLKKVKEISSKQTPIVAIKNNNGELMVNKRKNVEVPPTRLMMAASVGSTFVVFQNGKTPIAIPVMRKKLADTETGRQIVETITNLLDLTFTPINSYTTEQQSLATKFKEEVGINPKVYKDVFNYLSLFINTKAYKDKNRTEFLNEMNIIKEAYKDVSVFNFNNDGKPFFQFAFTGSDIMHTMDMASYATQKNELVKALTSILNNAYTSTDIYFMNRTSPIKAVTSEGVVTLAKNYKDFLLDNLYSTVKSETIQVGEQKEDKEIFTIQRIIEYSRPSAVKRTTKREKKEKNPTESAPSTKVPTKVETQTVQQEEEIEEDNTAEEGDTTEENSEAVKKAFDEAFGESAGESLGDLFDDLSDLDSPTPEDSEDDAEQEEDVDAVDNEDLEPQDYLATDNEENHEAGSLSANDEKSLTERYNFITGLESNILNSILRQAVAAVVDQNSKVVNTTDAINTVFKYLEEYIDTRRIQKAEVLEKLKTKDLPEDVVANLNKMTTVLNKIITQYNTAVTNKERLKEKLDSYISRHAFVTSLRGKELVDYKANLKAEREAAIRLKQEQAKKEGKSLDELDNDNSITVQDQDNPVEPVSAEEALNQLVEEEELKEYNLWDVDGIYINNYQNLNARVKAFFQNIRAYKFNPKTKEYVTTKNLLGLPDYITGMEAYLTVQKLLATFGDKEYVKPTFDNYVEVLNNHTHEKPFLIDVVEKLKNSPVSFQNAFVMSMHKQYNNLSLALTKINGETQLISSDNNNYSRVLLDKWKGNFNAYGNYVVTVDSDQEPVKRLDDATIALINHNYKEILKESSKNAPDKNKILLNMQATYKALGINLPASFYEALKTKKVIYKQVVYDPLNFAASNMFRYAVASVIGDNFLSGFPPNNNFFVKDIYSHSGFKNLADIVSNYEENLTSNVSRDINNNNTYNYSETKNLVDAFMRNKYDERYLLSSVSDPYRDFRVGFNDDVSQRTWLQQLFKIEGGQYKLNKKSLFTEVFDYFTFNGTSFDSNKGKERIPVEKLSELGTLKTTFNLFLNNGQSAEDIDGTVKHIGYLPFFTMSNKKVPIMFKVPMEVYDSGIASPGLITALEREAAKGNKDARKRAELLTNQRNNIFNTLVAPELNRILAFDSQTDAINIAGYERHALKFYGLPFLNDIDFDYKKGNKEGDLDDGSLRKALGLEADENFTTVDPANPNRKIINTAVLKKDSVQNFIKDRVIEHLADKVQEAYILFEEKGLIKTERENGATYRTFLPNKGVDTKAIRTHPGYQESTDGIRANEAIINFVFNTELGYANMQQMLVGDPIQFAKLSASESVLKMPSDSASMEEKQKSIPYLLERITEEKLKASPNLDYLTELSSALIQAQRLYDHNWAYMDAEATYSNQAKRLAGDNASGQIILPSKDKSHFNFMVIKDFKRPSDFLDYYRKVYEEAGYSEVEVERILDAYTGINTADAQELTSFKEYLDILVAQSELEPEEAARFLKDDDERKLNMAEFGAILSPMKLVYSNTFLRNSYDSPSSPTINSRLYIKSSSFPLTKTFSKGLPVDKLRQFMEDNKIDRIAFESAVKVGSTKNPPAIFTKDGNIDLNTIDTASHVIPVPREGHKKQQHVPYDEDKDKTIDGTQKSKLIFVNLMHTNGFINPLTGTETTGKGMYDAYIETLDKYYKHKYYKLKDKMMTIVKVENEDGTTSNIERLDYKKLHTLLKQEAESRNYTTNEKLFLELNENEDGFLFPLWLASNQDKIEALLNSIVDNKVRKRKRKGTSQVLVSDTILDIERATGMNVVMIGNRSGNLKPMREIEDENGKHMAPAEIVIPFPFRDQFGNLLNIKDFTNEDGTLNLEKIPEEALEAVGFRIPTQGINSMTNVKIVGFLPADMKNVVFAPRDFITQMGSDFDVDKLYIDLYNTVYNPTDGTITRITQDNFDDFKLKEKYLKILKKRERAQKDISKFKGKPEAIALYERAMRNANMAKADLDRILDGKTQEEFLDDYYANKDLEAMYYENMLLEFHNNILANPHNDVQSQRIQPIDNKIMLRLEQDLLPKFFKNEVTRSWTPYNYNFQMMKYMGARGGKSGVSAFSSDSVLNALLQSTQAKKHINYIATHQGQEFTIKYRLFGEVTNNLNNPYSADGNLKSDIIQAMQSLAVDNETKLVMDKLNINEFTFDFIRGATQGGFSIDAMITLLNHPLIKDYVNHRYNEQPFVPPVSFTVETEANGSKKNIYYTSKDYDKAMSAYSIEEAQKEIEDNVYDRNSIKHAALFDLFLQMSDRGKQLKQLESIVNVDSKGIGSNLFYSLNKEEAISDLYKNGLISNITELIGIYHPNFEDTTEGESLYNKGLLSDEGAKIYRKEKQRFNNTKKDMGFSKTPEGWFKGTTIAGLVSHYALRLNNKIWNEILPYNQATFEYITDAIYQLRNNRDVDLFLTSSGTKEFRERMENNSKFKSRAKNTNSISSTSASSKAAIESDAAKEFKSFLFSSIASVFDTTAENLRNSLINEEKLPTIIQYMQESNVFKNNKFIQALNYSEDSEGRLNIVFNASTQEIFDEESMIMDFISLIESTESIKYGEDTYSTKDIANMLIQHQFITGGLQQSSQFIKYIPIEYLKNIGLYEKIIGNTHKVNLFLEQYIRHHPELVYSDALRYDLTDPNGLYIMEDGVIHLKDDVGLNTVPTDSPNFNLNNYISLQDKKGVYSLYKRSPFNNNTFLKISVLGKGNIKEYDAEANDTTISMYDSKNHVAWYDNLSLYQEVLSKGYNPIELRVIKEDLETKGQEALNDGASPASRPDLIFKICK